MNTPIVNNLLLGMIAMASFAASLFFFKFWKNTQDRFFLFFAGAFAIEAVSRTGLALANPDLESFPTFYLIRLIAFGLILAGILYKNNRK